MTELVLDRMLIGGSWQVASDRRSIDVIDPATEEVIADVPSASPDDLDLALDAAEGAWRSWSRTDPWTRSSVLRAIAAQVRAHVDSGANVMTVETGKPLAEAKAEMLATADQFDWYADEARRIYGRTIEGRSRANRVLVWQQPVGPVATFTAWNFPALLPSRKIAPAIAAGCSVIAKPAEEAPRTLLVLANLCRAAGLPDGVLNVVTGDPAALSSHLIASPVIRKVSLTGSVPVGRAIMHQAAERILPVSMELGGHAPVLVFADADLEQAVDLCVRAKYRNCGQVCISPTRFFVHESVAADFAAKLAERARALVVGDPRDPSTDVGPLANSRRRDAIEDLLADATGRGATVLAGGNRCDPLGTGRGFFFEPTVLGGVDDEMGIMRDEPFGPVAPVAAFNDLDEILERANDTPYGLAGYVFTNDLRTAFEVSEALEVGMVGVNNLVIATAEAPFGGVKQSGFGREGGSEGITAYTVTKYVNMGLA